jgi:hypothetical protein
MRDWDVFESGKFVGTVRAWNGHHASRVAKMTWGEGVYFTAEQGVFSRMFSTKL